MTTRESEHIAGVYTVDLRAFPDDRGFFFESFRRDWIPGACEMVQGNVSFSRAGVLRGLHYHRKQADFWVVPSGLVQAALYDLRRSSSTQGNAETLLLGTERPYGLYIPRGVAHGFCALTDSFMTYLVDEYYDSNDEYGIQPVQAKRTHSRQEWDRKRDVELRDLLRLVGEGV